jgi:myo-inositol catabolism protein IolS
VRYTTFGRLGWQVSVVGFGSWGLGGQWGAVERHTAEDTVDAALESGINLIDTADAYGTTPGTSEEILGKVLLGRRHQVYLTTKVGNFARRAGHPLSYETPLHVMLCCDASLHRLRTDYVDVYFCHIGGESPTHEVFLEAFERLADQGKIRAYGISTDNPSVLAQYAGRERCGACQLAYSLLDRRAEESGLLEMCRKHDIGTLIRSPLRSGLLTGKFSAETRFADIVRERWNEREREGFLRDVERVDSLKGLVGEGRSVGQVALAALLAKPGVHTVIPGAKSPEQVRANATAADLRLAPEEVERAFGI